MPANRLHLVSEDKQGAAWLKLRPRFREMPNVGSFVDVLLLYDAPPTIDELYRATAKNHELDHSQCSPWGLGLQWWQPIGIGHPCAIVGAIVLMTDDARVIQLVVKLF